MTKLGNSIWHAAKVKEMKASCSGLERCCYGGQWLLQPMSGLQQKKPSAGMHTDHISQRDHVGSIPSNAWSRWGVCKGKNPIQDPSHFLSTSTVSRVCPCCVISEICVSVLLCVGYKMKKRVGAIEEFEFLPLTEGKQLHITIAITGWLCAGKYGKSKMKKLRGAWTVSVSKSCLILLGRVWLGLMTSTTSMKCLIYLRDLLFILQELKENIVFLVSAS